MKKILGKKERSFELNSLDRILIDFKSLLVSTHFYMYKLDGLIYYMFDTDGFFTVSKKSDYTFMEQSLDEDEYFRIKYDTLRDITKLKKSEVTEIYSDDNFTFETNIEGVFGQTIFVKNKDNNNILKNTLSNTSKEKLQRDFTEAVYDVKKQILTPLEGIGYPYKITFSDDINFKLKIENPNSVYYMRLLNEGAFIQVVTKSEYKEIYEAQSMLFVFNYRNKKEV